MSSGNVSKYEFGNSKSALARKHFIEKAAALKRFQYSPLGKELKAQTDITKKQFQKLNDTFEFDKTIHLKTTVNQI